MMVSFEAILFAGTVVGSGALVTAFESEDALAAVLTLSAEAVSAVWSACFFCVQVIRDAAVVSVKSKDNALLRYFVFIALEIVQINKSIALRKAKIGKRVVAQIKRSSQQKLFLR